MSQQLPHFNDGEIIAADETALETTSGRQQLKTDDGWTFYLVYSILASVLGTSFMYGYNSCVINAPYDVMSSFVNKTYYSQNGETLTTSQLNTQWSIVVSLFILGGVVGSVWLPDAMANRYGRTRSLLYTSIIGAIGGISSFIAPYSASYLPLMLGRFLVGFHSGITMVIIPALLVELPPVRLRGACGSFNELTLVIGVVFSNLVGLRHFLGTEQSWQFLFLLATCLYVLHAALLIFAAESPRWLIDKKRDDDAMLALEKLRKQSSITIRAEFSETKATSLAEAAIQRVTILDFVRSRNLFWPLILSINLHLAQQFTGISAVSYYSSEVMIQTGLDEDTAKLANFAVSFIDVFATLISTWIVDRIGRRFLMLLGLIGMCLSHVFLTIVLVYQKLYACIAGLAFVMFTFSIGPGPIPWFMTAEMFTQAARPLALSICLFVNWVANLAVGLLFPQMRAVFNGYAFLPFAIWAFFETVFLFAFLPETNGILVEDVVAKFSPGQPFFQFKFRNQHASNNNSSDDEVRRLQTSSLQEDIVLHGQTLIPLVVESESKEEKEHVSHV